eukprot:6195847-Pleurochrysis_carterae.AAC.1
MRTLLLFPSFLLGVQPARLGARHVASGAALLAVHVQHRPSRPRIATGRAGGEEPYPGLANAHGLLDSAAVLIEREEGHRAQEGRGVEGRPFKRHLCRDQGGGADDKRNGRVDEAQVLCVQPRLPRVLVRADRVRCREGHEEMRQHRENREHDQEEGRVAGRASDVLCSMDASSFSSQCVSRELLAAKLLSVQFKQISTGQPHQYPFESNLMHETTD